MLKRLLKSAVVFLVMAMSISILLAYQDKPNYIDVYEVRKQALERGEKYVDDSPYFIKDADGYIVNSYIYSVNAETLRMLTDPDIHVEGDGFVRWKDWTVPRQYNFKNQFTGIIPVEKLKDPIFMSMNLPSEIPTYMKRTNPYIISNPDSRFKKIRTIGAIYKNEDAEIPDDAEITICLVRTTLLLSTTESDGWYIGEERAYPTTPISIFYLPWTL